MSDMPSNKYLHTFDDFLAANPNVNPEWRDFMEPVIQDNEDALFQFIIGYIFM